MNIEMRTKTVYKKCTFPSDIDTIFRLLTDLKTLDDLSYIIGTGYGRNKVPQADENISEIICLLAVKYLYLFVQI